MTENKATTSNIESLLIRTADGDQSAFQSLYDLVAPQVLGFLRRLLRDRQLAEDVLQDAMVQTWHSAKDFNPERAKATTWITAIARNKALDLIRSRSRFEEVIVDDKHDIQLVLGYDRLAEHSNSESSKTSKRLVACFDEVGQDSAASIQLAYLDGCTFSEVASALDRSVGTVKSWVRRGLIKLRECMSR